MTHREHWQRTYETKPDMYGMQPSEPAINAVDVFRDAGVSAVLELGAGHGRDSMLFAEQGFRVIAADFSSVGLRQLQGHAKQCGLADRVSTLVHDVRNPLPLADGSVGAVFAHMLLCMALSTVEIHVAVREIARVLRAGGVLIYTVRHTGDAHYGTGIAHGDNIYEQGGFAVHFFDRSLVESLAEGWELAEWHHFTEGELPRELWRITQVKVSPPADVS